MESEGNWGEQKTPFHYEKSLRGPKPKASKGPERTNLGRGVQGLLLVAGTGRGHWGEFFTHWTLSGVVAMGDQEQNTRQTCNSHLKVTSAREKGGQKKTLGGNMERKMGSSCVPNR